MFNLLQNPENREKGGRGVRGKNFELQLSFIRCSKVINEKRKDKKT